MLEYNIGKLCQEASRRFSSGLTKSWSHHRQTLVSPPARAASQARRGSLLGVRHLAYDRAIRFCSRCNQASLRCRRRARWTTGLAMNIYWSLRNVPELAPLSPADRRRVHEACLQRYFWRAPATWRSLIAYLMLILCPAAFLLLTTWLVQKFGGSTPLWLLVLTVTVGAMFGHFVFSRIAVSQLRQFYPDYIQKELRHDVA